MNPGPYKERLAQFREHIVPAETVLVVTHDYPDPDCIASAFGISHLLASWGVKSSVITFGGFVGRAENRAMIRFLNIQVVPFPLIELRDFQKIIVVDTFPGAGNMSLARGIEVHAVFDHHLETPSGPVSYYFDIRKEIGATSTMVTKYLLEAQYPISPRLATALFYGIKTDTRDMGRDYSNEDLECYRLLFDLMDYRLLSDIENPDRDVEFFRIIHSAAESAIRYGNVGFTHLGNVPSPDYIAEMADFFQTMGKLEWMICSGVFKKSIFFSIRSKTVSGAGSNAEKIARALGGSGGGHGKIGAGHIALDSSPAPLILDRFIETFKGILRITDTEPEKILEG